MLMTEVYRLIWWSLRDSRIPSTKSCYLLRPGLFGGSYGEVEEVDGGEWKLHQKPGALLRTPWIQRRVSVRGCRALAP